MPKDGTSREQILEVAARILSSDGPSALSTRRLASELDVSTMVVYTRFGSMPDLLDAVVEEGFKRLTDRLGQVDREQDSIGQLLDIGDAYRANAVSNPHLYAVMFSALAAGERAEAAEGAEPTAPGLATFEILTAATGRAVAEGSIDPGEPAVIARQVWSAVHGFVMLELAGLFVHDLEVTTSTFHPLLHTLVKGLGGSGEACAAHASRRDAGESPRIDA